MSKKVNTLTLRRHGEFTMKMTGDSHCGLDLNQKIKYNVAVTCKSKGSLDGRGFLFEQLTVDQLFQDMANLDAFSDYSCEQLSMEAAEDLLDRIRDENPGCKVKTIEVTLSAKPYVASMTFLLHVK